MILLAGGLGCHLTTRMRTGPARLSALLQIVAIVPLTLGSASLADLGADTAGLTTERRIARHQLGAGTGNRGGIQAEPDALLHGVGLAAAETGIGTLASRLDNRRAPLKTLIHQRLPL